MFGRIRGSWSIFAGRRPGLRFRERYRLRQSRARGRSRWHPARLLHLTGGTALIVLSAFFGWMPVLGWGTAIVGLAMIAGEFYPAARLMDRLEPRARRFFKPLGKKVARLPAWARLSASLGIALATFVLLYGLYSLALGG
ncbi:MAG: hypothetical protein M3341_11300 [Actinomycetota bacterium]|nr:hypothetical protein [Actinomycetota bacterium]